MTNLAFIEGIWSPVHWLVLLFVFGMIASLVLLIVLLVKRTDNSGGVGRHIAPMSTADADLNRRRQELELDRMALENEERRRKLNQ